MCHATLIAIGALLRCEISSLLVLGIRYSKHAIFSKTGIGIEDEMR